MVDASSRGTFYPSWGRTSHFACVRLVSESTNQNRIMNNRAGTKSIFLFILSYLGFLTHLGLETMLMHFSKDSYSPEDWQEMVEMMSSPGTGWMMAVFSILSALPILLAIIAEKKGSWMAAAIVGFIMTILHALHYGGELAGDFGGVGVSSIVLHVIPSAWASVLAWKQAKSF